MTARPTASDQTATILEIQRMSTEDGPGLRTTIFFKGCSLTCRWCHNPESISAAPQLVRVETRCIACDTCLSQCLEQALSVDTDGFHIDRALCRGCGRCADVCPTTALELLGQSWTMSDLLAEVLKDRAYFDASDEGGVTVSGGEPALQARFVAPFLAALQQAGVHTALDTCGMVDGPVLADLLPHARLVLFDLKLIDAGQHRKFTGRSNQTILDNAVRTARLVQSRDDGRGMWIRTPIIPGATDTMENIRGIGRFIADHLGGAVDRWELCAFNNLCADKYRRLDRVWPYEDQALLEEDHMAALAEAARRSGVDPSIVRWSGATRLAPDTDSGKRGNCHV